jgi:hypothetical protein
MILCLVIFSCAKKHTTSIIPNPIVNLADSITARATFVSNVHTTSWNLKVTTNAGTKI